MPDIEIEERQIDFGGVTFGDTKVLPLTFINESDITAKVEVDIRDYPEFEIILPDPNPDDDNALDLVGTFITILKLMMGFILQPDKYGD